MTDPNMYYETFYKSVNAAMGGNGDPAAVGANVQNFLKYPIYTIPEGENLFTADGKINPNATLGAIYKNDYYLKPDTGTMSCLITVTFVRNITYV